MSVDDMIERIPTKLFLSAISLYSLLESYVASTLELWGRMTRAFHIMFRPEYYIFFEGSAIPHNFYNTHYWASGSATPELMYCANTKAFFPWIPRNSSQPTFDILAIKELYRPLSLLSLEIIDSKDKVVYDLTEFLETLRHVAVVGFPSPSLFHILSAWSLSSGVVPNLIEHSVRFIDANGDCETIRIYHKEDSVPVETTPVEEMDTTETVPASVEETGATEAAPAPAPVEETGATEAAPTLAPVEETTAVQT